MPTSLDSDLPCLVSWNTYCHSYTARRLCLLNVLPNGRPSRGHGNSVRLCPPAQAISLKGEPICNLFFFSMADCTGMIEKVGC